jgi:hypothetical protein
MYTNEIGTAQLCVFEGLFRTLAQSERPEGLAPNKTTLQPTELPTKLPKALRRLTKRSTDGPSMILCAEHFNILQPNNKALLTATHCCPRIYNHNNANPKTQSKQKNQPKPQSAQGIVQRLLQQQQRNTKK